MDILKLVRVSKSYQRGNETIKALDDISLSIEQPEILALAGPSGSGKSTLLNLLARFDDFDSGQIHIDGQNIAAIREAELDTYRSSKLGFIFQQFNLVKVLTAAENVELSLTARGLPKSERQRRAQEMLGAVGLGQRCSHRPDQLSGGQQQRVAIARALVGRPRIVIADEPAGNLDGTTAQEVLALMKRLNVDLQTTFVIATHDRRVMDMAHRVITLADGKVQA